MTDSKLSDKIISDDMDTINAASNGCSSAFDPRQPRTSESAYNRDMYDKQSLPTGQVRIEIHREYVEQQDSSRTLTGNTDNALTGTSNFMPDTSCEKSSSSNDMQYLPCEQISREIHRKYVNQKDPSQVLDWNTDNQLSTQEYMLRRYPENDIPLSLEPLSSVTSGEISRPTGPNPSPIIGGFRKKPLLNNCNDNVEAKEANSVPYSTNPENSNNSELERSSRNSQNLVSGLPMNRTLESQKQDRVVIISPTEENARELISNPVAIMKAIEGSPFNHQLIKDIRVNKKKNIIAAELREKNQQLMDKLVSVTSIGTWKVKCYQPLSDTLYVGVISPISIASNLEETRDLINENADNNRVLKIERLYKRENDQWVHSPSVKLVFSGKEKVEDILIGKSFYRVRSYVPDPAQCFNCQRLAHTSNSCTAKIRCLLCAGQHNRRNCTVTPDKFKCANCGGGHKANSKTCPIIKKAYEIEKLKTNNEITHREARDEYISSLQRSQQSVIGFGGDTNFDRRQQSEYLNNNRTVKAGKSFSQALTNGNNNVIRNKSPKDATTQTSMEPTLNEDFIKKIGECFMELLIKFGLTERTQQQEGLVQNILQKNLGQGQSQLQNVSHNSLGLDQSHSQNSLQTNLEQEQSHPQKATEKTTRKRPPESEETSDSEEMCDSEEADDQVEDEEGVISDTCKSTAEFLTVEKRQVLVNPSTARRSARIARKKAKKAKKKEKKEKKAKTSLND